MRRRRRKISSVAEKELEISRLFQSYIMVMLGWVTMFGVSVFLSDQSGFMLGSAVVVALVILAGTLNCRAIIAFRKKFHEDPNGYVDEPIPDRLAVRMVMRLMFHDYWHT